MSMKHPKGTRLAAEAAAKAKAPSPVIIHPKGKRLAAAALAAASSPTVIHPKGKRLAAEARAAAAAGTTATTGSVSPLQGLTPGNPTGGYADDGQYYPPGTIPSSDGGSIYAATGQKVKGGATMAARANAEFQTKIMEAAVVVAIVIGIIYVVKRYHILSGGK